MVVSLVTGGLAAGLAGYWVWETRRHQRYLRRIPARVHVNGTRGKSSVTRLIAAGLRAGSRRTFAKTTGTMARMILPTGDEVDVFRVGRPNIIEQTRIVRRAVEAEAEVLVIECMAVNPELQVIAEDRLIRSTVGVITNARADHLDVMGPTVDDVARVLAQTIPKRGWLFTAERERAGILKQVARERGSQMQVVEGTDVTSAELDGFSYIEHADNIALALAVCSHLGVGRATALAGMQRTTPDPGALRVHTVRTDRGRVSFVNAFAANDPDSTLMIWRRLSLHEDAGSRRRIVLANCRGDRVQRSEQIADLVATALDADHVVLTGQDTHAVASRATARGLPGERLTDLGGMDATAIFDRLLELAGERAVVFGVGNIVGLGEEIVACFQGRAVAGA